MIPTIYSIVAEQEELIPVGESLIAYIQAPSFEIAITNREIFSATTMVLTYQQLSFLRDTIFSTRSEFVGTERMRMLEAYALTRNAADAKRMELYQVG